MANRGWMRRVVSSLVSLRQIPHHVCIFTLLESRISLPMVGFVSMVLEVKYAEYLRFPIYLGEYVQ